MIQRDDLIGEISNLKKRVDELERIIKDLQNQIYALQGRKKPQNINPYKPRKIN